MPRSTTGRSLLSHYNKPQVDLPIKKRPVPGGYHVQHFYGKVSPYNRSGDPSTGWYTECVEDGATHHRANAQVGVSDEGPDKVCEKLWRARSQRHECRSSYILAQAQICVQSETIYIISVCVIISELKSLKIEI